MSYSNGPSEEIFQRIMRDRDDARRQIDLMRPKLQAMEARLEGLDRAKEVLEDYFGVYEAPKELPAKNQPGRRRGRRVNGQAKAAGEPKKVSVTSAAALNVVLESPMGVTINDIVELLGERGMVVRPGPLTRSLNFHASHNMIYQGDDGLWRAAGSHMLIGAQEMPAEG